jgi:hypothetical protein
MSARKKAPKVEKLVLPDGTWSSEPVEPVVEQHVPPIVPADELKMPERLRDVLDRALAEGTVDAGDGCTAQRLEPPAEAALVSLPKSQLLYVSFGDIRPANRRLAVVLLQPAALNGWQYLKAQRLLVEASVPIFMALENLFGRGERWSIDQGCSGQEDMHSKKMTGVEKVESEAMVEIDNSGLASASKTQFIKFRGTWLPFRKISKILSRAAKARRLLQPSN